MMSHTIRLISITALRPPLSRPPSHGGVIGLPNPLKALRATHAEVLNKTESTESVGRIEVGGQVEMGVVPLEGTIIGNRTVMKTDERRTIFWTESGLTVGTSFQCQFTPIDPLQVVQTLPGDLREIWSSTVPPIDAGWIDQSSFMLAYPVRIVYPT